MRRLCRPLSIADAEYNRREDCFNYDSCIMTAVKKKYASFSCIGCEEYQMSSDYLPPGLIQTAPDGGFEPDPDIKVKGSEHKFRQGVTDGLKKVREECFRKTVKVIIPNDQPLE